MSNKTKTWVEDLARTERWPAERIASYVQRGWSFLGVSQEDYEQEKAEIIALVKETRKPTSA